MSSERVLRSFEVAKGLWLDAQYVALREQRVTGTRVSVSELCREGLHREVSRRNKRLDNIIRRREERANAEDR